MRLVSLNQNRWRAAFTSCKSEDVLFGTATELLIEGRKLGLATRYTRVGTMEDLRRTRSEGRCGAAAAGALPTAALLWLQLQPRGVSLGFKFFKDLWLRIIQ